MDSSKPGRVRIIAGAWRGRKLGVPPGPDVRPTPDRVRETLFNWLGQWLDGLVCLDLFAGSGALGFEAASRGARRVVMVEQDRRGARHLEEGRRELGAAAVEVVCDDALAYLRRAKERFDVVFLDPPFRQNALPAVFGALASRLSPGARVYVEAAEPVPAPAWGRELRRGRAGQVSFQLFQGDGDDQGGLPGDV